LAASGIGLQALGFDDGVFRSRPRSCIRLRQISLVNHDRQRRLLSGRPDRYLMRVQRNGMKPEAEDGDLELASPAIDPHAGQIICIEKNDGTGYMKRLVETITHFCLNTPTRLLLTSFLRCPG
jgi:hypothetical protein